MAKKTIPISSAKVGMYLCGIDCSWLDTPFLRHRFLIQSSSDLTKLRQCGIQDITIDTEKGLDEDRIVETENLPSDASAQAAEQPENSFSSEIERIENLPQEMRGKSLGGELHEIRETHQHMLEGVQTILETLSKTGGIAVEQVNDITHTIMADTLGHEEAAISLIRTREFSPALYDHTLAVSTLSVLLGRAIGLDDSQCQDLATAGLLHDAGLVNMPHVIHKPFQELSQSEAAIYSTHPQRGLELLLKESTLSENVQRLIREHHVALDGSGYPGEIDTAAIQLDSRVLRLVDEYDELLSGQKNGKPQTVRKALQLLYQQAKQGVIDAELTTSFINLIGIYPTYSFVELSTGERGIVTANSKENLLHPTILLIQDSAHQPLSEPIPFNFAVLGTEHSGPEIVKILPPEEVEFQMDAVLEDWVTL